MDIYDDTPIVEYIVDPPGFVPCEYTGAYPPIQKLPDGRLVVDFYKSGDHYVAKVWERRDHPNIALLPADIPRVVKAKYRAENQLKRLRMTTSEPDFAGKALEEYAFIKRHVQKVWT